MCVYVSGLALLPHVESPFVFPTASTSTPLTLLFKYQGVPVVLHNKSVVFHVEAL